MADWLLDFIEMTEYIPSELRLKLTSIRRLDLQIHNALDELERDFKQLQNSSQEVREKEYERFMQITDVASKAASEKITWAEDLYELIVKSMQLLERNMEGLRQVLLEGDKAYIVEDLERKSQELEEQQKLEQANMLQERVREHKNSSRGKHSKQNNESNHNGSQNNHQSSHHHSSNHHRIRNNSTGTTSTKTNGVGRQRKSNSTMSIFNRIDDESTSETLLNCPLGIDYLTSNNSINNSNNSNFTLKGMMTGNIILSGIAAHAASMAVSPKLSVNSNANGDKYNLTHNISSNDKNNHSATIPTSQNHPYQQSNSHLTSTQATHSRIDNTALSGIGKSGDHHNHNQKSGSPFPALPLSSRHDPIMMAASLAINETQNMTTGRRSSSLKASFAAVNSGRPPSQQIFDQQGVHEIYCKCRSHIEGENMIACDNPNCTFEWFHYRCVGITTPPSGQWWCEDCLKSNGSK